MLAPWERELSSDRKLWWKRGVLFSSPEKDSPIRRESLGESRKYFSRDFKGPRRNQRQSCGNRGGQRERDSNIETFERQRRPSSRGAQESDLPLSSLEKLEVELWRERRQRKGWKSRARPEINGVSVEVANPGFSREGFPKMTVQDGVDRSWADQIEDWVPAAKFLVVRKKGIELRGK